MTTEATRSFKTLSLQLGGAGMGFDLVKLLVDGAESQLSVEQFKRLPLLDRVRLLASGELRFFSRGAEIPAREALRGL